MADSFDVVVFGATGVTGREVARYLGRRARELGLSWAAAGRDPERVRATLHAVGARPDGVLTADTADRASIDDLAAASAVLVNLVGPYSRHGEVVYEACINQGIIELDLTGELDWLAGMLFRHGAAAAAAGARLIPVAGFEALPFDLGARFAASAAYDRFGEPVALVDVALTTVERAPVRRPADAVSGGTWASAMGMLRRGPSAASSDARLLDPPEQHGQPRPFSLAPRRHPATGAWLAPLIPSPLLNPPVAHRSAALLRADGDPVFSERYQYREGTAVPGLVGAPVAASLAALQVSFGALTRTPAPLRRVAAGLLERLGPAAGEGPAEQDLDRWRYRLDIRATTEGGSSVDAVVEAQGHPGYKSTATMVAEAALILADPASDVGAGSGFLTPATAIGLAHLDRFAAAGLTFRLV